MGAHWIRYEELLPFQERPLGFNEQLVEQVTAIFTSCVHDSEITVYNEIQAMLVYLNS